MEPDIDRIKEEVEAFMADFDVEPHFIPYHRHQWGPSEYVEAELGEWQARVAVDEETDALLHVEVEGRLHHKSKQHERNSEVSMEQEGSTPCSIYLRPDGTHDDWSLELDEFTYFGAPDELPEGLEQRIRDEQAADQKTGRELLDELDEMLDESWSESIWNDAVYHLDVWPQQDKRRDEGLERFHAYLEDCSPIERGVAGGRTRGISGLWKTTRVEEWYGEIEDNYDALEDWDSDAFLEQIRDQRSDIHVYWSTHDEWAREEELQFYLEIREPGRFREVELAPYPIHKRDQTPPLPGEPETDELEESETPAGMAYERCLGNDFEDAGGGFMAFEASEPLTDLDRAVLLPHDAYDDGQFRRDAVRLDDSGTLHRTVDVLWDGIYVTRYEMEYELFALFK